MKIFNASPMEWTEELSEKFNSVIQTYPMGEPVMLMPDEAFTVASVVSVLIATVIQGWNNPSIVNGLCRELKKFVNCSVAGADKVSEYGNQVQRNVADVSGDDRAHANDAAMALKTVSPYIFGLEAELRDLRRLEPSKQNSRQLSKMFRRYLSHANLVRMMDGRKQFSPMDDLGIDFVPGLPG